MASENTQKYLDQDGVSTLWSQVVEKIDEKNAPTQQLSESNASNIETIKNQIKALQDGAYDDTEVRRLISNNLTKINAHIDTTNTLQGDVNTSGSIRNIATAIAAAEIAKVVANADSDFDTLKEIADWILNDTTGAADMANDIAALQNLVGNTKVATQISNAITSALKTNGVDKYALATELTSLANRVQTLEKSGFMNAAAVDSAIDAKVNALKLASTYETKGAAATALTNAKAYSDANLAISKTYADTNKVDINKPILKNIVSFRDENNAGFGAVLSESGSSCALYLGIPTPPTQEEWDSMEEEEKKYLQQLYGDAQHCTPGMLVFTGENDSMTLIMPLSSEPGVVYALTPTVSGEIITSGWLESNANVLAYLVADKVAISGKFITQDWLDANSDYLANLVINKLPTYTGGDY